MCVVMAIVQIYSVCYNEDSVAYSERLNDKGVDK